MHKCTQRHRPRHRRRPGTDHRPSTSLDRRGRLRRESSLPNAGRPPDHNTPDSLIPQRIDGASEIILSPHQLPEGVRRPPQMRQDHHRTHPAHAMLACSKLPDVRGVTRAAPAGARHPRDRRDRGRGRRANRPEAEGHLAAALRRSPPEPGSSGATADQTTRVDGRSVYLFCNHPRLAPVQALVGNTAAESRHEVVHLRVKAELRSVARVGTAPQAERHPEAVAEHSQRLPDPACRTERQRAINSPRERGLEACSGVPTTPGLRARTCQAASR